MSDKPDYYQVLGVDKKASKADIKTAYQKICMKCHPDMVKNKTNMTEAQKKEAIEKFKSATEAEGVLSDDLKRETYDKFGHRGLENLAQGKSGSSGRTYEEVAGPRMKRVYSEDDTFSFFEKRKDSPTSTGADDGLTPEQRRERARQERLARRGKSGDAPSTPSVKEPFDNASSLNVFHDVTEKVSDAAEKLGSGVVLPFEVLEKFRDNLQDLLKEVDKAIGRAKPGGPKFS